MHQDTIRAPVFSIHRTDSGVHLVAPSLPRVLNDALYSTEAHWVNRNLSFQICRIEVVLGRHHHSVLERLLEGHAGNVVVTDPGLLWKLKGTVAPPG